MQSAPERTPDIYGNEPPKREKPKPFDVNTDHCSDCGSLYERGGRDIFAITRPICRETEKLRFFPDTSPPWWCPRRKE